MTMHALSVTTVILLPKAGHTNSSVAISIEHRDVRFLKSYQNRAGSVGKWQLEDVFGMFPSKNASIRDFDACNDNWNDRNLRGEEEGGSDGKNDSG